MAKLRWVYGNRNAGYAIKTAKRKKCPYETQVWFEKRIYRRDCFLTEEEAKKYISLRREGRPKKLYPKRR